jgi:hypothetical protein
MDAEAEETEEAREAEANGLVKVDRSVSDTM